MTQKSIKSQTTPSLYSHPTTAEMRPSRTAIIIAHIKELSIFIGVSIVMWFVITITLSFVIGG